MPKVKCISIPELEKSLVVGQVYDAAQSFITAFWELRVSPGYPKGLFAKSWFEEEKDSAPNGSISHSPPPTLRSGVGNTAPRDEDEERCWRAMRPRLAPGHCICECPRELCRFHRD